MAKIILKSTAKRDLESIISYIENDLNSPTSAKNLLNAFNEKIARLKDFPELYPEYGIVKDGKYNYRLFPVNNYLVIYYVYANDVYIRRIIYSKRDIAELL